MKSKHPKVVKKKLGKERAWGQYHQSSNTIEIDERLRGKKKLEILTHEYLHHIYPFMDEAAVEKSAKDISDFLWKHDLRFTEI